MEETGTKYGLPTHYPDLAVFLANALLIQLHEPGSEMLSYCMKNYIKINLLGAKYAFIGPPVCILYLATPFYNTFWVRMWMYTF